MADSPSGGVMMDALSSMSPDQIQKILAMGGTPEQEQILASQMAQANFLRNTPNAQGRHVGNFGRVYVAPNPLEVLGTTGMQYAGMNQAKDTQAKMLALAQQNQQGRQSYLDVIRQMLQNRNQPPGGGTIQAGGGEAGTPTSGGDF